MTDDGYLDYIRPRGLPVLKATLRVVVAVVCLGAAMQILSQGETSVIAGFLEDDLSWPAERVEQVDRYAAWGLIACGVLTLLRPCWPVLLPVTVWFAGTSLVPLIRSDEPLWELVPALHASRYGAPLGLLLLDFWPPSLKSHLGRTVASMWLLRLAAAATFAGLGLLALSHSLNGGESLELLQVTCDKALGWEMTAGQSRWALAIVGGVEIGLALNVLVCRSKPIVLLMVVWGVARAAAFIVLDGPQAYPQALLRAADGGIPLVLLLYWSLSIKEAPVEVVKAN